MKKRPLILKTAALLLMLVMLSGCWNRREMNTISIVLGVAIDKAEEEGQIEMTVQVAKPGGISDKSGGGGGEQESNAYALLTLSGDSIFNIVREFSHIHGRKLYFPHNKVLIFSEAVAREGIEQYLDFFLRDHETRMDVWLMVTQGKAADILAVDPAIEKIPAMHLSHLIQNQRNTSEATCAKLMEFTTELLDKTTAPLISLVARKDDGSGNNMLLEVSGMGIFKQDKMVGILNKSETRGMLWLTSDIKKGVLETKDNQGMATVEFIETKTTLTPKIKEDGAIVMDVLVEVEGTLGEMSGYEDMMLDEVTSRIEGNTQKRIWEEAQAAFNVSHHYNADIMAFGEALHRDYPKEWNQLVNNWEEVLPTIGVDLTIKVKVLGTGRITKLRQPGMQIP